MKLPSVNQFGSESEFTPIAGTLKQQDGLTDYSEYLKVLVCVKVTAKHSRLLHGLIKFPQVIKNTQ